MSKPVRNKEFPAQLEVIRLERCDSTNNYIKSSMARWRETNRLPVMVTSGLQTAGRGREQRYWESPPGMGLYTSFGFYWELEKTPHLLPLITGLAVIETIESVAGICPGLKWPNDILWNGRKLSGILIENVIAGEHLFCVTGIGINVNQENVGDFPSEIREKAVSVKMAANGKKDYLPEDINRRLANVFFQWLDLLRSGNTATVITAARRASAFLMNKPITFHQPSDNRLVRGIFRGLSDDGALILETGGREQSILYSGEIL